MDLEIELGSPVGDIDWNLNNILDDLPTTPSPPNNPHVGLHESNLTIPEQQQQGLESCTLEIPQTQNNLEQITELTAATTPVQDLVGSVVAPENQVQSTEPALDQATSFNGENPAAPTLVGDDSNLLPLSLPNFSAPLLNEITQSGQPSSSAVGLILEGEVSLIQDQDMTQMGCLNQFSDVRNENLHIGINHQSSPHPALFNPNPVEASTRIGTGQSSGQFITNQRSALFPLQNHFNMNNPHTALNSWWPEHNQFSAPSVYYSQYAPSNMQYHSSSSYRPPQLFTRSMHQVDHASGMQKIFDLQSQNFLQPVNPMYPRLEPYSYVQPAIAPMPPNPYVHQHGYRPMQLEPAAPSAYPYPPLYDDQSNHHSQAMMPSGHGQKGVSSMQLLGSQREPDQMNKYNRLLNTPNVQHQSSILHEPTGLSSNFISSQALSPRNLDLSGNRMTEGSSSQVFSSRTPQIERLVRPERASRIQLEQVVPTPANDVTTQRSKGKFLESSTTRAQPSEAIQRILNMNPRRRRRASFTRISTTPPQQNPNMNLQNGRGSWMDDLEKQLARNEPDAAPDNFTAREGQYEPPRRGRPPKPREEGESSKRRKGTGSAGTTPTSQEADKTPENVTNEDQNANPANPLSALRQNPNTVYDITFERNGVPIDPYLRSFKALPEK